MTEYTIEQITGSTVMEKMRKLIKTVVDFMNEEQGSIDLERQERTAADTELRGQIDLERQARIQQIDTLTQSLDTVRQGLEAEVTQRTEQDSDINSTITEQVTDEAHTREYQDGLLRDMVNNVIDGTTPVAKAEESNTVTGGLKTVGGQSIIGTGDIPVMPASSFPVVVNINGVFGGRVSLFGNLTDSGGGGVNRVAFILPPFVLGGKVTNGNIVVRVFDFQGNLISFPSSKSWIFSVYNNVSVIEREFTSSGTQGKKPVYAYIDSGYLTYTAI